MADLPFDFDLETGLTGFHFQLDLDLDLVSNINTQIFTIARKLQLIVTSQLVGDFV
jgi:hypothetical protein